MKAIALRNFKEKHLTLGKEYDYVLLPVEGICNVRNNNGQWVIVRVKDFTIVSSVKY